MNWLLFSRHVFSPNKHFWLSFINILLPHCHTHIFPPHIQTTQELKMDAWTLWEPEGMNFLWCHSLVRIIFIPDDLNSTVKCFCQAQVRSEITLVCCPLWRGFSYQTLINYLISLILSIIHLLNRWVSLTLDQPQNKALCACVCVCVCVQPTACLVRRHWSLSWHCSDWCTDSVKVGKQWRTSLAVSHFGCCDLSASRFFLYFKCILV